MVLESLIKYPDYMMDFEYISSLALWQKAVMYTANDSIKTILREKTMEAVNAINPYWKKFVPKLKNIDVVEFVRIMHKKHVVTTFDVLSEYVAAIIKKSYFTMEYDVAAQTVRVRVKKTYYDTDAEKLIRKLLPCNLLLDFQEVEELG